jgi:hypothetical protein
VSESGKPHSGGNLKYVLGGLVLLAGAAAAIWSLRSATSTPARAPEVSARAPATAPQAPHNAERVNPMAQPDLILDEPSEPQPKPANAAATASEKPKPAEARGDWDCAGDLSVSALQAVVDGNRAQVRNCYERRLRVDNMLQGDLKLKLKVASTGQISATSVTGTLKDNEVVSCVRALAQRWTFPAPSGGACAVVQVPFQFAPKQ